MKDLTKGMAHEKYFNVCRRNKFINKASHSVTGTYKALEKYQLNEWVKRLVWMSLPQWYLVSTAVTKEISN